MSSLQRLWNLIDTKHHTKHHRSENCHLIANFWAWKYWNI